MKLALSLPKSGTRVGIAPGYLDECGSSPIDDVPGCVHTDPQTAVLKYLHPAHMLSRQETPDSSYIPPGLPAFQLPPFGFTRDSNTTVTFYEMTTSLGWGILILPLVGLLENIAICKAFSNGKPVDASQELLALGISNIGNSLVQGFPGSGSLSRSAVNNSSGVRTPMGGLYTGDTHAQPVVRGPKRGPQTIRYVLHLFISSKGV
uniref:SLC26A/SulP transporter domain-containing protein n=1 Tax=Timema poppense TaxID=170557 RepID=A0A7R9HGF5_TIMPO|nr:unnamed protein product [Timema poppensis]